MTESLGIMDEGYFVSRKEILRWINHTLHLDLAHIQQLGSGAVYCQLLDAFCPGMAPMQKVNWRAKQEYEFLQNFKVLQSIFDKVGISKKIQIQKLAKCKYQDNLEFIQWLKRYIELQGGCKQEYDPEARRGGHHLELQFTDRKLSNNITMNKENIKRKELSSSMLDISIDSSRKSSGNILDMTGGLRTPTGRKSISNLSSFLKSSSKINLPSRDQPNKINQIKDILTKSINVDSGEQLDKIRKLLNVPQISQEQDLECI